LFFGYLTDRFGRKSLEDVAKPLTAHEAEAEAETTA
jgi:hypothetical protein